MLSAPLRFLVAGLTSLIVYAAAVAIVFQAPPQHETATAILLGCLFCTTFVLMLRALEPLQALPTLFCMFFFSFFYLLPGVVQLSSNTYQMADILYSDAVATKGAIIVLLFLVFFFLGQQLVGKWRYDEAVRRIDESEKNSRVVAITAFCLASVVLGLLCISRFGFGVLLATRGEFRESVLDNIGLTLTQVGLLLNLPRAMTLVSMLLIVYAIGRWRRDKPALNALIGVPLLALLGPIFAIVNFPPALARNWQFGILLSFLIVFVKRWRPSIRVGLVTMMVLAMFSLFQWLNVLRNYDKAGSVSASLEDPITYLKRMDFDGFQTTMNTVIYTELYDYTYGNQLLSSIFFAIPRSIWTGKGEGTGIMVGKVLGLEFTNLSTPMPAEFFVDFSFAGVMLGGLLIGYLYRRMDYICAAGIDYGRISIHLIIIAIATAYTIFIMRGTLLAVAGIFGPMSIFMLLVLKAPAITRLFTSRPGSRASGPPLQTR